MDISTHQIYAINVIINVKHVLRLISVHHAEINISWIDKNVTNVILIVKFLVIIVNVIVVKMDIIYLIINA